MLTDLGAGFAEAFLTAPSPGIVAAAVKMSITIRRSYLQALAEALRVEYEAIVRNGFLLQVDCPISLLSGISRTAIGPTPSSSVSWSGRLRRSTALSKYPQRSRPHARLLG